MKSENSNEQFSNVFLIKAFFINVYSVFNVVI